MGKRKVRCFSYDLKLDGIKAEDTYLKDVTKELFNEENNEEIRRLENGNLVNIIKGDDIQNYLSIELIEKVEKIDNDNIKEVKSVEERFLFFRIGRQKDIEGALKRNIETWEGEDIIDVSDQGEYNLEICTYILVDIKKGIILELFGKYAPSVKSFKYILNTMIEKSNNAKLKGIEIDYKKIMTAELIETLINNGTRLGQITYNYENPNLDILKDMGFTAAQINVLKELNVFQLEVNLKGRARVPLTKVSERIGAVINTLGNGPRKIKEHLIVKASTASTSSKNYTFEEEDVTYNIDIPYNKIADNRKIKLSLDEIAFEVYTRLENMHRDNISSIETYISRN